MVATPLGTAFPWSHAAPDDTPLQTRGDLVVDTAVMVKISRRGRTPETPKPQVSAGDGAVATVAADTPGGTPATTAAATPARRSGTLLLLARSAHPRWALALAVGLAAAAAASGREPREVALVAVTVLVGQAILGWHNDLVDRGRDARHDVPGKPLADGRLEPGTVWFAVACAVLLLIPLTVTNGITAGSSYLLSVLVGILGNVVLRRGLLSWVTWAASYALLPAFLSYGGWGGQAEGDPPRVVITVLFAALGVGLHLFGSVWGLVPDDAAGWKPLPLRVGRRIGSSGLLVLAGLWVLGVLVALVVVGVDGGLSQ